MAGNMIKSAALIIALSTPVAAYAASSTGGMNQTTASGSNSSNIGSNNPGGVSVQDGTSAASGASGSNSSNIGSTNPGGVNNGSAGPSEAHKGHNCVPKVGQSGFVCN